MTQARSWISFFFAMLVMGFIWFGCYYATARYANNALPYFKYGAFGAITIGIIMLVFNELIVKISMRAKRVKNRNESPKLWDAVASVTPWYAHPKPRIYVVDSRGMNAFAFGLGLPFFSAVAATRGIIDELSSDELRAVMAHEIGHIINKDILISMAMTISVMMMAFTGWLMLRVGPYMGRGSRSSSSSKNKSSEVLALLIIWVVGFVLYVFGRILGSVLQMFVSRQREYAADAKSAAIIGSHKPLCDALNKITRNPRIGSSEVGAAFGFLCTADPEPSDLMSTHPNLQKRLLALEALSK